MLKELIVRNIVLIEKLHIEFEKGLSVLTGETGTGKSILLDSLGLITGNRVDYSLIRNSETEASVTAIFYLVKTHPVKFVLKKYNISELRHGFALEMLLKPIKKGIKVFRTSTNMESKFSYKSGWSVSNLINSSPLKLYFVTILPK